MAMETIAQVLTVLVAVLGIIWHQQRSTEKLREEFIRAINGLRDDHNGLRHEVISNGQRLARIEGFLRIGMPAPAESGASETPETEPISTHSAPSPESAAEG